MAQIGLKNLYYSVITIGTGGAETYATPKKIGNAVSVDISPSIQTTSLYGDDMAVATDVSLQEVRVTIETTDIPLEDQAALLGHTYNSTSGLSLLLTSGYSLNRKTTTAVFVASSCIRASSPRRTRR